jgi:hypothetical protein
MVILMVGAGTGIAVTSEGMETSGSRYNVTCGCTTGIAGVEGRLPWSATDSGCVMFSDCGTSNKTARSATARPMICSSADRLSCSPVCVEGTAAISCPAVTGTDIGMSEWDGSAAFASSGPAAPGDELAVGIAVDAVRAGFGPSSERSGPEVVSSACGVSSGDGCPLAHCPEGWSVEASALLVGCCGRVPAGRPRPIIGGRDDPAWLNDF